MAQPAYETCPACGRVQTLPELPDGTEAACGRCGHALAGPDPRGHDLTPTFAAALAAALLYPVAVSLPIMELERFGNRTAASLWTGGVGLLEDGHLFVGGVVLLCSVVLPVGKLLALLVLSSQGHRLARAHRLLTWRIVELTGRWGMLDVLLIACLVAWMKLGDLVRVEAGPAATAFTACVVLSLLASAFFDPRALWVPGPLDAEPAEASL